MAGLRSFGTLILIINIIITIYSSPVNISPQSVPESLIQSAINSLNANSPTQHTYRGGNLISAQKLLEPALVIYRLTLNLDTVCSEGSTSCPREACAIDLKDRSGDIEVDRNSIQCMYLYPQSAQEDVQQVQQTENVAQDVEQVERTASNNADHNINPSENTLQLDHEVEAATNSQRVEPNSQDKPFIAVRAPNSNYCPGCPYELNPNLPGLTAFGVQALDMMDRLGQNDFKHKMISIIKVTRAVPLGSNVVQYKLLAEIGESNCLKTTLTDRSECSLQGNIPTRVCLVTFEERPWQHSDRQVVGNNCTEPFELDNEINAGLNPGLNSQPERVDSVQEVIGKTAHIDQLAQEGKIGTYDSLIDQLLETSVANVTQELNPTEVPIFETVHRKNTVQERSEARPIVTEAPFVKVEIEREEDVQQVQRFVDKQKEFDEFLSDFDIPLRDTGAEITTDNRQAVTEEVILPHKVSEPNIAEIVTSSSEEDSSEESLESKENTGGPQRTKRDLNKSSAAEKALIKELARKAVATLDDIDQDDNKRVVRRILEFRRQKSDGFLYHLAIEVALTDCSELNNYESDDECLKKSIGPVKICKVQIHTDEKNPRLSARVVKSECFKETSRDKNKRNKRTSGVPGAANSISVNHPDVKKYANLGVQKYSQTFGGTNEPILIEILSATRQIVEGSLYKINVRLGESGCPKGTNENCQLRVDSERKECEIKAWSRPWLSEGGLEITVNCDSNSRAKRSLKEEKKWKRETPRLRGAPNPISVDHPDVTNYASLGLQKFSETSGETNEPILVEIVSATKQTVAGTLYKINVKLGTSDCPKGVKENCQLLANSEKKECEIQAWSRPWLSEGGLEITVNCDSNSRAKRSLKEEKKWKRETPQLLGAPNSISVDHPDVTNYASLGLQKFSETSGETNEPILVEIVSATKQTVAGTLYKINVKLGTSDCPKGVKENCQLLADSEKKECEIKAWSRPWLSEGGLEITVNCDSNSRAKRSSKEEKKWKRETPQLLGAPNSISVDHPDVTNYASLGLQKFSETSHETNEPILVEIVSATKQTVAGTLYKINVKLGTSDCPKGVKENCQLLANSEKKECEIQAWSRPWLSEGGLEITVNCDSNSRAKRSLKEEKKWKRETPQLVGSPNSISVDHPDVTNYASLGLQKFSETSDETNEPILVEIVSATKQTVAGTLYKINVKLGTSDCPKGVKENCQLLANSEKKECEIQAWSRPWLSEGGLEITVNCDSNSRAKRSLKEEKKWKRETPQLLGAPNSISVDHPDVTNYASLGLQKFSETSGETNEPILVEIVSATKQTVAGTLYKINVKLGTSDCPKGVKENCQLLADSEKKECEIQAWSRPWLSEGGLEITVNCDSNSRAKRSLKEEKKWKRETPQLVGSPNSISVDHPDVTNYASLGLQKFSETSDETNEPILVEIVSATKQTVAGTLYKINVKLGTSDCPKGVKENCQLLANSEKKECEIQAWSRPWLSEGGLEITVNCELNSRSKRSLRGKNYSKNMMEQSNYLRKERLFNDFTAKYNKTYSSKLERKNRFKIFNQNMMMVQELQRNEQGTATYGASIFADLTTEEFKKMYLGLKPELRLDNEIPIPMAEIPDIKIPEQYDWRDYNVVTPVKNQGSCGSCWAFSVTGNVEGQYAIRHRNLLSFSEQELVDCDTLDQGCNGGLPDNAYRAIEKLGGLELESDYPYDGENEACHFNKTEAKAKVVSAVNITSNETQMAQWLVQNGPISIGINANAMQFYMGGISHPYKFLCSPSNLDHGVLIVGYGIHTYPIFHKRLPYWTIKNSWGPSWGEKGYYRVYRGDGTCGVNQMASSAIVA